MNSPLVTVCELHVHCVAAEKCLAVQRDLDVGGVRNGVTDQHQIGDRWFFVAIGSLVIGDVT